MGGHFKSQGVNSLINLKRSTGEEIEKQRSLLPDNNLLPARSSGKKYSPIFQTIPFW
jgi:hypothetical protein